jgi:chromosome segregation ATPase
MNHTNETITNTFNDINEQIKELNNKINKYEIERIIVNERLNNVLEKNTSMEKKIEELNKIMMKFFAYRSQQNPIQQPQNPIQQPQNPIQLPLNTFKI